MRKEALHLMLIIAPWLLCGCGQKNGDRAQSLPASTNVVNAKRRFGEEELAKLVRAGMSKQTVIDHFGKPDLAMENQDGFVRFDYFFPQEGGHASRTSFVSGVTVYFRDDVVFRWAPIYTSASHGNQEMVSVRPKVDNAPTVAAALSVSLWIVNTSPIDGGRYIDTERLPKLGYIANQPTLVFKRLKTLEEVKEASVNRTKDKPESLELHVSLYDEDALAFKNLTTQNLRKRLLLMVGNRPVTAPLVIAPVPTGVIRIPCDNLGEFQELREELAKLLPPP